MQTVVLKVSMSCQGCAGAVRRALAEIQGEGRVESFDVNLKEQKVRVTISGNVQPQTIFEAVSKTGKTTELWDFAAAADGDL
ncbi:hypothetical protein V2J09_000714 [Rumex salicifolius]